jgi:hypothetical protein
VDSLQLTQPAAAGPANQTFDSPHMLMATASYDSGTTAAHSAQWRTYASSSTTLGGSQMEWDSQLDGGGFTQRGALTDAGDFIPANATSVSVANAAAGTTSDLLAVLSGNKVTTASLGAASGIIGVVVEGAGTTGSAIIAQSGRATCTFDTSGVTAGNYVIASNVTAGDCADSGTNIFPSNGGQQVVGRALTAVAAGGGNGTILVLPQETNSMGPRVSTCGAAQASGSTCGNTSLAGAKFVTGSVVMANTTSVATITFAPSFTGAPICTVSEDGGIGAATNFYHINASGTTLTIDSNVAVTANKTLNYICIGK